MNKDSIGSAVKLKYGSKLSYKHKKTFESIRTDCAVIDLERGRGMTSYAMEHRFSTVNISNKMDDDVLIEWTPSQSLAILTFRMCHNLDINSEYELCDDEEKEYEISNMKNQQRINRNMRILKSKKSLEKRRLVRKPLHMLAWDLYATFIPENSEMEINISGKSRSQLHFFFHQSNLPIKDIHVVGSSNERNKLWNSSNDLRSMPDFDVNKLEERENPTSPHSAWYLYRLFHIFDGAWGEIWHLILLNSYPRFIASEKYLEIKEQLEVKYKRDVFSLARIISADAHTWFDHIHPRKLIVIGVDPLPVNEQIAYFGKPLSKVKKAKV